jgi:hypothetical protein
VISTRNTPPKNTLLSSTVRDLQRVAANSRQVRCSWYTAAFAFAIDAAMEAMTFVLGVGDGDVLKPVAVRTKSRIWSTGLLQLFPAPDRDTPAAGAS